MDFIRIHRRLAVEVTCAQFDIRGKTLPLLARTVICCLSSFEFRKKIAATSRLLRGSKTIVSSSKKIMVTPVTLAHRLSMVHDDFHQHWCNALIIT